MQAQLRCLEGKVASKELRKRNLALIGYKGFVDSAKVRGMLSWPIGLEAHEGQLNVRSIVTGTKVQKQVQVQTWP